MATTALFFEHLITGLQAGIWVAFLSLSCLGFEKFSLDRIKGYEALVSLLVVSIVYPLGVFIDNLADDVFKPWNRRIRVKHVNDESISVMTVLRNTSDTFTQSYFGYIRTRIRISRSASLNFALITISSIIFTVSRLRTLSNNSFRRLLIFEIFAGVILTLISIHSWYRISQTFAEKVAQGHRMNKEKNAQVVIDEVSLYE